MYRTIAEAKADGWELIPCAFPTRYCYYAKVGERNRRQDELLLSEFKVTAVELEGFDPSRYDAKNNGDGTYTLTRLKWWDDASYAAYQADCGGDDDFGDDPPRSESDLHNES